LHWLHLTEFTCNNSVHASTSTTLFYSEKSFHPSIKAIIQAIPAYRQLPDVPDAEAQAEWLIELTAVSCGAGRRLLELSGSTLIGILSPTIVKRVTNFSCEAKTSQ
jgi:hypothetical protein